ncbi:MAG: hypothetical protein ACI8QD_000904 [Cyclobacteriaceae bacterium]|jgi:hypothetical protein
MHRFLIILLLLTVACKGTKQTSNDKGTFPEDSASIVEELLINNLGKNYECQVRNKRSLCTSAILKNPSENWPTILVIDHNTSKILYGPEKTNSNISWHSDEVLKMIEKPEFIKNKQSAETFTYYYNLNTKRKAKASL